MLRSRPPRSLRRRRREPERGRRDSRDRAVQLNEVCLNHSVLSTSRVEYGQGNGFRAGSLISECGVTVGGVHRAIVVKIPLPGDKAILPIRRAIGK